MNHLITGCGLRSSRLRLIRGKQYQSGIAYRSALQFPSVVSQYRRVPLQCVWSSTNSICASAGRACSLSRYCSDRRRGSLFLPGPNHASRMRSRPSGKAKNPALAAFFGDMTRRGTILEATIWAISPDTAVSTSEPALPPNSCDDVVGAPPPTRHAAQAFSSMRRQIPFRESAAVKRDGSGCCRQQNVTDFSALPTSSCTVHSEPP